MAGGLRRRIGIGEHTDQAIADGLADPTTEGFRGRGEYLNAIADLVERRRVADLLVPARAAADDNARATVVFISGVRGCGFNGNGLYRRTSEMNDYRVLYVKEGDDGWWLEHCRGQWQLKQKEHKGKDLSWAKVVGECALEACGSRVWRVSLLSI
jgi:hypothetical protein